MELLGTQERQSGPKRTIITIIIMTSMMEDTSLSLILALYLPLQYCDSIKLKPKSSRFVLVIERSFSVYKRSSKVYQGCRNLEFKVLRDCVNGKATEELSAMAAGGEETIERSPAITIWYRPTNLGVRILLGDCRVGVDVDLGTPELEAWEGENKCLDDWSNRDWKVPNPASILTRCARIGMFRSQSANNFVENASFVMSFARVIAKAKQGTSLTEVEL
jgi:hypothetical protein